MLERFEKSDGLGAIYPAMLNSIIALRCLGYSPDDPQFIRAMDEFEKLGIDKSGRRAELPRRRPSACSPAFRRCGIRRRRCYALGEAGDCEGRSAHAEGRGLDLMSKEVRNKGDWSMKVPNVEPGGWYFEFNNEFYPDVDDSAQVLLALNCVSNPRERYQNDVASAPSTGSSRCSARTAAGQLRQRQHAR